MLEKRCRCGAEIPRGFGYYNYGATVRCFFCGRDNQKCSQNLNNTNEVEDGN